MTYLLRFPEFFNSLVLVTLLSVASGRLVAVEPPSGAAAEAADQLKQLNDQTIIESRILLDTEWDHFTQGAERITWSAAGLWGWRITERQDWAIRLKVAFIYNKSGDASGRPDIGDVGDLEVGTGTAFRLNSTWRIGAGMELHGDTASDPAIGEGVWRLKSFWGIAHDFTDWLTLTFDAEYNHSIAEEHDVLPQRYLELSLPATFILPHEWSTFARYKATIDFENGDRWGHTVNAGVAKRLANVPVVLSAALEKPLSGGAEKVQVNFRMIHYFGK